MLFASRFPAEWRASSSPLLLALRRGVARPRLLATVPRWRGPAGAMDVGELLSYQVSGAHQARGSGPGSSCRPAGEGRGGPGRERGAWPLVLVARKGRVAAAPDGPP